MARMMPNFSHGTAGIAYFLARLNEETKEKAFLDSAVSGARYLQAIAATAGRHVPDPASRARRGRQEPVLSGLLPRTCRHGAPLVSALQSHRRQGVDGVGPQVRARDHEERVPEQQTPGFWNNVGQCCGSAGVAEFFLHLHKLTGSKEYLAFSERMTGAAARRRHARRERPLLGPRRASGSAERGVRPRPGGCRAPPGSARGCLRLDAHQQNRQSPLRFPDLPF